MAEETQKIQTNHKDQKEKPQESKEMGLDDEETELDRTSRQSRPGSRGKPRRVIDEWANDPYCE